MGADCRPGLRTLIRWERLALLALLLMFFVLATAYNFSSTPFEAPDEIGHFYYVVHLLQNARLPVVPAEGPHPNYEHEGAQPPLYYATSALFVRALAGPLRLSLEDVDAPLDINPHSACGRPDARYNVAYLAHDPHQERFPYQGRVRVLHVVRLWSSLLATATVAGVFAAIRLAFPDVPVAAWIAAGLTAFTPEFLFTAGAVSNDNLVTALATWGVYLALRVLRDGVNWLRTLALGALAGLAALSKFSGALLLPLSVVVVSASIGVRGLECSSEKRRYGIFQRVRGRAIAAHCALLLASFAIIAGWWFVRNWTLYGDLTGTRPILEALALRSAMSPGMLVRELPGLFRSWWGVFGCTAPPDGFYLFYLALSVGGLGGLVAGHRRHGRTQRSWLSVGVLLLWLGLMFAAYVRWNWVIHASKGRLLYPALVSVMGFLGLGWAHWVRRWRWVASGLLVCSAILALAVPFAVMAPAVFPPRIHATVAHVHPEHRFDGQFGSEIALLGYDLNRTSFEPGDWLDITFYWQALTRPADHYTLAIQMVSAVPGDIATLINFNTWTGGGNYPTGAWHPGDVISDRYRLRLPEEVHRAQAWYLQIALFDIQSGVRIPLTVGGEPVGDAATLHLVRVGATDPEQQAPPEADRLTSPVYFGEAVALDGVRVWSEADSDRRRSAASADIEPDRPRSAASADIEPASAMHVICWWRSIAPLPEDYVVFVHLYDAEGRLVATADAPPLAGGFPVRMWRPGDRVVDERTVSLPGEADLSHASEALSLQLGVGWYDPATGARLAVTAADDVRLPNAGFDSDRLRLDASQELLISISP